MSRSPRMLQRSTSPSSPRPAPSSAKPKAANYSLDGHFAVYFFRLPLFREDPNGGVVNGCLPIGHFSRSFKGRLFPLFFEMALDRYWTMTPAGCNPSLCELLFQAFLESRLPEKVVTFVLILFVCLSFLSSFYPGACKDEHACTQARSQSSASARRVLRPAERLVFLSPSSSGKCSNRAVVSGLLPWGARCPFSPCERELWNPLAGLRLMLPSRSMQGMRKQ